MNRLTHAPDNTLITISDSDHMTAPPKIVRGLAVVAMAVAATFAGITPANAEQFHSSNLPLDALGESEVGEPQVHACSSLRSIGQHAVLGHRRQSGEHLEVVPDPGHAVPLHDRLRPRDRRRLPTEDSPALLTPQYASNSQYLWMKIC
jgi:hypothetical protein